MQHLKALEISGLVASEKEGRVRTVRLEGERSPRPKSWLSRRRQEWEAQLDRFEEYLSTLKNIK